MKRKRPDLIAEENYQVRSYPEKYISSADYVGYSKQAGKHVFFSQSNRRYFLVDDNCIHQNEDDTITHFPASTAQVISFTKNMLNNLTGGYKSALLEILENAGVALPAEDKNARGEKQ